MRWKYNYCEAIKKLITVKLSYSLHIISAKDGALSVSSERILDMLVVSRMIS